MPNKLISDPQLQALVRELNATQKGDDESSPVWLPSSVSPEGPLKELLTSTAERGASDLLVVADAPPMIRLAGRLVALDADPFSPLAVQELLQAFLTPRLRKRLTEEGAADFSLSLDNAGRGPWRFRGNVHRQRGSLAAAFRVLPAEIPTLGQLNLPSSLAELVKPARGLVLVCGPTGSGKSSTLAALIGEINRNEARHIVTIEDPIEYEHRNSRSLIEQIEVGRDAVSFASALRASLRQNPDVIMVGEMRDLETVSIALTAAETGHLILSTLHTSDVASAIHRIIDVFPAGQQMQVRQQVALALNAILVQQLVPRSNQPGRSVAIELLLANHAVRTHIRKDKVENLISEITLGRRSGMISLEDSLGRLVREGLVTAEDARIRSSRPEEMDSVLR